MAGICRVLAKQFELLTVKVGEAAAYRIWGQVSDCINNIPIDAILEPAEVWAAAVLWYSYELIGSWEDQHYHEVLGLIWKLCKDKKAVKDKAYKLMNYDWQSKKR